MNKAESNMSDSVAQHVPPEVFKNMSAGLLKNMAAAASEVSTTATIAQLSSDNDVKNFVPGKSTKGGGLSA